MRKKTALFSVRPHKELEQFGRTLIEAGWVIIATKDACKFLLSKGIEVLDVADFVNIHEDYGFPPTLHPKMEAALTKDAPERIDLVYDIPYGLEAGNDVGGRALLALAAKGNRIPVMDLEDMEVVISSIRKNGDIEPSLARHLIEKANLEISLHYAKLASSDELIDQYRGIIGFKKYELKNGENPYQVPASLYAVKSSDPLTVPSFKQISGELPCFTNIADLDSMLETLCRLHNSLVLNDVKKPYIVVSAKHGNPCGVAVSLKEPAEAVNSALWGNARAVWGGEVITNFTLDKTLADLLKKSDKRKIMYGSELWMLDLIASPGMDQAAVDILSSSQRRKLFVNPNLLTPSLRKEKHTERVLRGGFLSQTSGNYILDLNKVEWINGPIDNNSVISLIIAWAVVYTSNLGGNEVAIAKDNSLLGIGGGPSTFDAVKRAITSAKEQRQDIKGSVFGADAFFPFTDVPEILFNEGCIAGSVPAGGKNEQAVAKYFAEKHMNVALIPEIYRGFCRH